MNILGTEYNLVIDSGLKESDMADGICQGYSKIIKIRPLNDMLEDSDSFSEKQERYNEVLRHKIIHAFFFEAGLDDNEQTVEWFAMQFPKMLKIFQELNCTGVKE